MAVELNFNRADNSIPWGFRLTGGADLDVPLTVIKVAENSIADEVGMKLGDLLVRISDTPAAGLTHLQAHDLIKEAGNTFAAAVIRGELPAHITETEQTIDSETTQNGISQSLQINIKANVVDTTHIVVESGEVIGQNIRINGSVVSDQDEQNVEFAISREDKLSEEEQNVEFTITREEKLSEEVTVEKSSQETRSEITESQAIQIKDELSSSLEKMMQPPECIIESEVLKVIINEQQKELKGDSANMEKRWTTFLQKPERPKPKIKQIEVDEPKKSTTNETYEEHVLLTRLLGIVQEPPYRVIIQKQKKERDAEKAAMSNEVSQEVTPVPPEVAEEEQEEVKEEGHGEEREEGEETNEEYGQPEEAVISEVEMSLEVQLAAIQRQLLALSQLPAAIQQTLDVVTQQLTNIVGPVNDPNTEELEADEFAQQDELDDSERETDLEERTGDLETLEEVSESGFDRDSQQGEDNQDAERLAEEGEFDKPEPELEMLQVTPEPEDDPNLTPEEREARRLERAKMDKQQKVSPANPILSELRQRRIKSGDYPLTPLQRPICLPGGRKWHAPDDAHPALTARHHDMSDEQIAETISAQTEVLVGTTLGDANTHLVPSKVTESKKINFLKYQPAPQSLDHLKHSEVFRLVHDMDQPVRGVGTRPGKAMAEEDYYAQARSGQEGQMKG